MSVRPLHCHFKAAARPQAADAPLGQAAGSAGADQAPSWLCSSISAIPAVPPKLPSIWNGRVDIEQVWAGRLREQDPQAVVGLAPPSRAHWLMSHARLQPVYPPPARAGPGCARGLGECGRVRVIGRPGCTHKDATYGGGRVRFGEVGGPLPQFAMLAHSEGGQPVQGGSDGAANSASTPSIRAAARVFWNTSRVIARSAVVPAVTSPVAGLPSGVYANWFSGEVDGHVTGAVRRLHQEVQQELRPALHRRVDALGQELPVPLKA